MYYLGLKTRTLPFDTAQELADFLAVSPGRVRASVASGRAIRGLRVWSDELQEDSVVIAISEGETHQFTAKEAASKYSLTMDRLANLIETGGTTRDGVAFDVLEQFPEKKPATKKTVHHKKKVEIDGKTLTIEEWSELSGVASETIYWRLRKGKPAKEAVWKPAMKGKTKAVRMDKRWLARKEKEEGR